jgi:hypothetical protein
MNTYVLGWDFYWQPHDTYKLNNNLGSNANIHASRPNPKSIHTRSIERGSWPEQRRTAGAHLRTIVPGANLCVQRCAIQLARRRTTNAPTSDKALAAHPRLGKLYRQQQLLAGDQQQELKASFLCCRAMGALKKTMSSASRTGTWAKQNGIKQRNTIMASRINMTST